MVLKNKKASLRDIIVIVVVFFGMGMALFITSFMTNTTVDKMLEVSTINDTNSSREALQSTKDLTQRFDYFAFGFLMALLLALVISGYLIGANKIFVFIYFIISIISVVTSAILSNVWQTMVNKGVFGLTVVDFPLTNHILSNYVVYVVVFAFAGIIAMFAKPR